MGKSELAAAVALLLTCGDGEERGEVYGCAADRQQASIVFEVAADMVRMCPALNKRVKILASQKRIVYQSTNSFYQVLSAEAYSKHGFNIHGVVFDELHTQPNRKLFDVMTKGSGDARTQPLYFLITTAGTDTNSICYETHQKAKDIIEGRKIDPTFYPVIYGAEETDDWTDPKVWKKANPSLGITVSIDKVQAACDSAKQNPGEENAFRQLRLNQWVKQAVRWMPMDKWDACNFHVNEDDLEGRVCYGGLDLSSTTDITAFVLVFPPMDEDDKFAILPYFWIPEDTLELRVRRDHVPYDIWERQGFLQTIGTNVAIRFATPIIIKACGNAEGFFNMLTEDWCKFHAITFCGGNINALYTPGIAIEQPDVSELLKYDGARTIKMRPWSAYTRTTQFQIENEKVTLTVSIGQTAETNNAENRGAYNLGKVYTFFRFSFENAQGFEKMEKYYIIARKIVAILTSQNNICFEEVYLSQRNSEQKYFKTGICKIFDSYENYSIRQWHKVIPIFSVFDYIPNLIDGIVNGKVNSLLELLPEDNKMVSLPLRADYDLTTVYGSALHYFAKSVVGEKKNRMPGKVDKPTQNLAI